LCFERSDRPGKDLAYLMNARKAETELGWKPLTELDDGIATTIRWVTEHLDQMRTLPLHYEHQS